MGIASRFMIALCVALCKIHVGLLAKTAAVSWERFAEAGTMNNGTLF